MVTEKLLVPTTLVIYSGHELEEQRSFNMLKTFLKLNESVTLYNKVH